MYRPKHKKATGGLIGSVCAMVVDRSHGRGARTRIISENENRVAIALHESQIERAETDCRMRFRQ